MTAGAMLLEDLLPGGGTRRIDHVSRDGGELVLAETASPPRHVQMQAPLGDERAQLRLLTGEGDRTAVARGAVGGEQPLTVGGHQEVDQRGALGVLQRDGPVGDVEVLVRGERRPQLERVTQPEWVARRQVRRRVAGAAVGGEQPAAVRAEDEAGESVDLVAGEVAAPRRHAVVGALRDHAVQVDAHRNRDARAVAPGAVRRIESRRLVTEPLFHRRG